VTEKSPLERSLFRLIIILKVAFWAALLAMLVKGIWATAIGNELADPRTLLWIVVALGLLQLGTFAAWWRLRRARLRSTS
jgi:hypothetical protein